MSTRLVRSCFEDFTITTIQDVWKLILVTNKEEKLCMTASQILWSLTSREQFVLVHRLGLTGEPKKTWKELGELLEVSRTRARDIYLKAIRRLQSPTRAMVRTRLEHDAPKLEITKLSDGFVRSDNLNLRKPLDEFEMTTRLSHCLQAYGTQYVGEVITKTERQLLQSKNFGRKSLCELKVILAELGLQLGMQIYEP